MRAEASTRTRRYVLIRCVDAVALAATTLLVACQSPPQPITVTSAPAAAPNPTAPPAIAPAASASPVAVTAASPGASPAVKPAASPAAAASPAPVAAGGVAGKPMYQMDALHTGRSPYTGPRDFSIARRIDLTSPSLRPADAAAINTPDIQSSTVVGPDGTIYATTVAGWTYALKDSASARDRLELAWRFRPAEGGSPFHGTPALSRDGSNVYVGYGVGAGPTAKAALYALKAPSSGQDAQIVWQTDLGPGSAQNSPTVTSDGTIYYVDVLGLLSVVDPTGKIKWTAQVGSSGAAPFGQTVKVSPAVAPDGSVYITAVTGSLYAVAPPSGSSNQGSTKWSFDFGEHLGPTPVASTAVTNPGNRGQDGIGSGVSPTIGPDGTIYAGADNSNFYAINPDGSMKWMYEAERELGGIWTSAALSPDASVLFFGANKGGLYALNTRDGSLTWQFNIEGSVYSSPALDAAGTLFTGSTAGHVFSIASADGSRYKDLDLNAPVWTAPSIRPDGTLVVADRLSNLYVLSG